MFRVFNLRITTINMYTIVQYIKNQFLIELKKKKIDQYNWTFSTVITHCIHLK